MAGVDLSRNSDPVGPPATATLNIDISADGYANDAGFWVVPRAAGTLDVRFLRDETGTWNTLSAEANKALRIGDLPPILCRAVRADATVGAIDVAQP